MTAVIADAVPIADSATVARNIANRGPLNEVVCGAMMLAYERSGCWQQAVNLLQRARNLGIDPNTIMYNTAISALGKSYRWEAAEQLFHMIPNPDTISYETMIAAYGLAGQIEKAETFFNAMLDAGHVPRDYAFCGLIAAYSNTGDWRSALKVRHRMKALGCSVSVHVYNALIATLERANQWDQALAIQRSMKVDGVAPDQVTQRLMESIGKGGIHAVEDQQVATAALAAAVAAAGSLIIRAGFI
jgi:pentatricopeptide repeat protein